MPEPATKPSWFQVPLTLLAVFVAALLLPFVLVGAWWFSLFGKSK